MRYLSAKISTLRKKKWRYYRKLSVFAREVRNVGGIMPQSSFALGAITGLKFSKRKIYWCHCIIKLPKFRLSSDDFNMSIFEKFDRIECLEDY